MSDAVSLAVPDDLEPEIRSDHAGETGAVWIYRGILAVAREPEIRIFARRHLETEARHLEQMNALLPARRRSLLLGPWRLAGFLTGALPALFGARAVYGTVAAVETFVVAHYQAQIDVLTGRPEHARLRDVLIACQEDEAEHRDEAAAVGAAGPLLALWCRLVGWGSDRAVRVARRI